MACDITKVIDVLQKDKTLGSVVKTLIQDTITKEASIAEIEAIEALPPTQTSFDEIKVLNDAKRQADADISKATKQRRTI